MLECSHLLAKVWGDLTLFEKKILFGIGRHIQKADSETKAYKLKLTEFGLDKLNPSDITDRLRSLQGKAVQVHLDQEIAYVPLLTDVRYHDHSKTVTITFNSLLKADYTSLGEGDFSLA